MIEFHQDGQAGSWLSAELKQELSPVVAPDSLWHAIHEQRRPLRIQPRHGLRWSAVAVALFTISASAAVIGRLTLMHQQSSSLQELLKSELTRTAEGSGYLDISDQSPEQVRQWVSSHAGIDVLLPKEFAHTGKPIQLLGVRILHLDGSPVAAISYRIGDQLASMLVCGLGRSHGRIHKPGHIPPTLEKGGTKPYFSWNTGGELYAAALVGQGDPRDTCLICHAQPAASSKFN